MMLTYSNHAEILRRARLRITTEDDLQASCAEAFTRVGIACEREHRLDAHNRVDLWLPCRLLLPGMGLVVECKIDGSGANVVRQVQRYLALPQVSALILVSTRAQHRAMVARLRHPGVHIVNPCQVL